MSNHLTHFLYSFPVTNLFDDEAHRAHNNEPSTGDIMTDDADPS